MYRTAQLDGSDAQGRNASTQTQRISAFINQLGDAVLILDSLDSSSLDQLKQDEDCKDLVRQLLSIFPIVPLSDVSSQIDQVVKAGLEGIAANIARLSLPNFSSRRAESRIQGTIKSARPSLVSSPPGTSPATLRDITTIAKRPTVTLSKSPSAATIKPRWVPAQISTADIRDNPDTVATIHFLRGGLAHPLEQIAISAIGGRLSITEGRKYTLRLSDQGSSPKDYLSLTSSPSTTSFSTMMKDTLPQISYLWTPDAITHVRRGGEVEYGITITDLQTKALFVEDLALILDQINKNYLRVQPGWLGRAEMGVSTTLANGVYLLSGDVGRLERLFSEDEKFITLLVSAPNLQGIHRTNHYASVIRPFCLRDRDLQ